MCFLLFVSATIGREAKEEDVVVYRLIEKRVMSHLVWHRFNFLGLRGLNF